VCVCVYYLCMFVYLAHSVYLMLGTVTAVDFLNAGKIQAGLDLFIVLFEDIKWSSRLRVRALTLLFGQQEGLTLYEIILLESS